MCAWNSCLNLLLKCIIISCCCSKMYCSFGATNIFFSQFAILHKCYSRQLNFAKVNPYVWCRFTHTAVSYHPVLTSNFLTLQQAYNAIAVSRQMKLLALNSTAKTSRDNSCEREAAVEEVRERSFLNLLFWFCDGFNSQGSIQATLTTVGGRISDCISGANSIKLYGSVNYGFVVTTKFWP